MSRGTCVFCEAPKGLREGTSIAFLATDLCREHLEMSGVPEYEQRHPIVDGARPCNAQCGCMTLTALSRGFGAVEPAQPAEDVVP